MQVLGDVSKFQIQNGFKMMFGCPSNCRVGWFNRSNTGQTCGGEKYAGPVQESNAS